MPFTPFHFGPGAALHGAAPRQVSFIAFCAANVLMDVEPLYYMLHHEAWLHRFFHTYVGATLVVLATCVLFLACRWFARRAWLPDVFGWQALALPAVAVGAALGASSHIVLDSIMHADIRPLAPFSDANGLYRVVSLGALHLGCLAAGALGLAVLGVRMALAGRRR